MNLQSLLKFWYGNEPVEPILHQMMRDSTPLIRRGKWVYITYNGYTGRMFEGKYNQDGTRGLVDNTINYFINHQGKVDKEDWNHAF